MKKVECFSNGRKQSKRSRMKTYGKYKRVAVKNLTVGDKIAICSYDKGVMKPNKPSLITIDKIRLHLLTTHKKLNYIFSTIDGMVKFCNDKNGR